MSITTIDEKKQLRSQIKEMERSMTADCRQDSDGRLFARFLELPELEQAETVLLFCGMGKEPDTRPLLKALSERNKRICLPRCLPGNEMEFPLYSGPEHMKQHKYGMWEPDESCPILSEREIGLVLVPAMCYDISGMRLGRGGGFYDRFLSRFAGVTVGLCRGQMLQQRVPAEPHDQGVRIVVTEDRCYR